MLAVQMAAVHQASMTFARRLAHVQNIPQQDAAERAFNKLTRTFTTQMEALKRYRSTGQQTVRVERVTVEAGGQAVVGAVSVPPTGGGWGLAMKMQDNPMQSGLAMHMSPRCGAKTRSGRHPAVLRRCRTDAAGCMEVPRPERPGVKLTACTGMGATRMMRWRCVAN